jgi:N-acetylglutamate synthase-like GNAT family acetyltransferase
MGPDRLRCSIVTAIDSMSADASFSIRVAFGKDAKAVRMLLSTAADAMDYCLVGECGQPSRIVAAAGLTRSQRPKPLVGPGVALHVIGPCRRRGIGKSLLQQLTAHAAARGAQAVYAAQKVELDSGEMRAWAALGFSPCETVQHHELPLHEFEPRLAPLIERMRQRGKIPNSARIIPLYEADAREVARLHLAQLGGDPATLAQKLRGDVPGSFAARYSRVLLVDDRVVGFILGHRLARDVVHVDANVLDPAVRGGWANVWLKLEATRGALQWGIKKFVFTTFDHYADTRSFTERMSGVTVRTTVLMYRPLATI